MQLSQVHLWLQHMFIYAILHIISVLIRIYWDVFFLRSLRPSLQMILHWSMCPVSLFFRFLLRDLWSLPCGFPVAILASP